MTQTRKFIEGVLDKFELTPKQLANKLGKSKKTVKVWLDGLGGLNLVTVYEIAEALDCKVQIRLIPISGAQKQVKSAARSRGIAEHIVVKDTLEQQIDVATKRTMKAALDKLYPCERCGSDMHNRLRCPVMAVMEEV